MRGWIPKDKEIENILERIMHDNGTTKVKTNIAQQFGRYDKIKFIRSKQFPTIYIAEDHKKNESIIKLEGLKLRKEKNKFFFDGL